MKTKLPFKLLVLGFLLLLPGINFGQAPPLGTAADFVLFTSVGAMTNVGTYQYLTLLTGNVGTNSGSNTNFGNVNGVMHAGDGASLQCANDLLLAYNFLADAIPDSSIMDPVLGNDSTIKAGTYLLPGATSLDLTLTLDAEGDPDAVFIFKMPAGPPVYAFSTTVGSEIILTNGAQACNVFWYVTGAVNVAVGTIMKGTIIAGGAISLSAEVSLEGRALTINGAVEVSNNDIGFLAYTPIGCGSPDLVGPAAPVFVASARFAVFSSIGNVTDDGTSHIVGDVGGNSAMPTGFNPLFVDGGIYGMDPPTTGAAAGDLNIIATNLLALDADIELLYPPQFGHDLVLTPHTYVMNGAATLTGNVYLDAMGNPDAVFIIKTYGAFASGVNSEVRLINGTQVQNVYWFVEAGAVSLGDYSIFNGTILVNNGAIDLLTGATLNGRALTTNGAISLTAMTTLIPYPPIITTEPIDQTACVGDSISFVVIAEGTLLNYQWRRGDIDLVDGDNISGATTDTLTINPVSFFDNALDYNVIVTGEFIPNDTSVYVSLTVYTSPEITQQPEDQFGCLDGSVNFTVEATGDDLTYQWRKGLVDLDDLEDNISGATTATLTINPVGEFDAGTDYNVVISGACAPDVTSDNVSLTISASPFITIQPTSQIACEGGSAIFTVVAVGDGLTYQWRKGEVELANGDNITGATTASLTVNPVGVSDAASDYNVIVSGTYEPAATSVDVALTVYTSPEITAQPENQVSGVGGSVSFTVEATGNNLNYQWRKGLVEMDDLEENISGATTATLTINPVEYADAATDYNVVVSGSCTPDVTSVDVSLTISESPFIIIQPTSQIACEGGSAIFTVAAVGDGLTYQWRKGEVELANGDNIYGATTASLTIDPVGISDAASDYNVIVSGTYEPAATSFDVALTVYTSPEITAQPENQVSGVGGSASFTVVATGSNLTYQWRKGLVEMDDLEENISGATTATLTINPVEYADAATDYNVVVSGSCTPDVTSVDVSLTISDSPFIIIQPTSQIACEGGSATFTVAAVGDGLTYQWRKGEVELANGDNITGATTASLTVDPVGASDAASNYNVIVSGTYEPAVTSVDVALTVYTSPEITMQPENQTECVSGLASFTIVAIGSDLTYQWRKGGVDLSDAENISGATTATLTIGPLVLADGAPNYDVVVTGICDLVTISNNASLVVNSLPEITSQPANQTECAGGTASFSVTATGTDIAYQWRKGTENLVDVDNISGVNTATLTIIPVDITDAAANYNVVVSGACTPSVISNNASLTVNTAPELVIQPSNQIACVGSTAQFSIYASGTGISVQWRKGGVPLTNSGNISGANSAILTISPVAVTDAAPDYDVIVTGTCGPAAVSNNASLVVNTLPAITSQPVNQTECAGGTATFSVTATGTDITYQWRKGTVNLTDAENISGVNTATLTIIPVGVTDAAANYNVVVSGVCSPTVTSNNASLTVNTAPQITLQPANQNECVGSLASFTIVATGTGLTYQWRKALVNLTNSGNISGATSATLTINPVGVTDEAPDYDVVVTGVCGSPIPSSNAALTVTLSPEITYQPLNQSVNAGGIASFSVTAIGTDLSYQWRKGTVELVNAENISGATSPTLTIDPVTIADAAVDYNVIVSGACAPAVTSVDVSLAVVPTGIDIIDSGNTLSIYPNPFNASVNIKFNDAIQGSMYVLVMYNSLGELVVKMPITEKLTNIETGTFIPGIYFYRVIENGKTIQSGKLIKQK
jgi:hypothetical protein